MFALLLICSRDKSQGVLSIAPLVKSTVTTFFTWCFIIHSFWTVRESDVFFALTLTRNLRESITPMLLPSNPFPYVSCVCSSSLKTLFILILPLFELFNFSAEEIIVFILVTTRPFVSPFSNIGKGKTFRSVAPLPTNLLKKVLREPYLSANPKSFSAASSINA